MLLARVSIISANSRSACCFHKKSNRDVTSTKRAWYVTMVRNTTSSSTMMADFGITSLLKEITERIHTWQLKMCFKASILIPYYTHPCFRFLNSRNKTKTLKLFRPYYVKILHKVMPNTLNLHLSQKEKPQMGHPDHVQYAYCNCRHILLFSDYKVTLHGVQR